MTEISIKDWIELPETQALERNYKELGLLADDSSWDDFTIVESKAALESYFLKEDDVWFRCFPFENVTYCFAGDNAMTSISYLLMALRMAAYGSKLEGFDVGYGDLILQDRQVIESHIDSDGRSLAHWRGAMFRVHKGYTRHADG